MTVIVATHEVIHVTVTPAVHAWLFAESGRVGKSLTTLVRQAIATAIHAATNRHPQPVGDTVTSGRSKQNATGKIALVLPMSWGAEIRRLAGVDDMRASHWTGMAVERFMAATTGAEVPTLGQKKRMTPEELAEKRKEWKRKHDEKRRGKGLEPAKVTRRQSNAETAAQRHAAFLSMCDASSRWPAGTPPKMWADAPIEFRPDDTDSGR